jgi:tRNA dimethylallyltransferase
MATKKRYRIVVQSLEKSARPIRCIAVTGPTCSGKTKLALQIAKRFSAEILNCDSVQFYRGFDIGSAKPTLEERRLIPHFGIDMLDPHEVFDAGRFAVFAYEICNEIASRGSLPLICGGSGLYLRSMLGEGFSESLPDRDIALRERIARMQPGEPYGLLKQLDPQRAEKIHPHDSVRIERGLELRILTGRPFSYWQLKSDKKLESPEFEVFHILITPKVQVLRDRIALRTQEMLAGGLVEECWKLYQRGVDMSKTPFNSIGYSQVFARLTALADLPETSEASLTEALKNISKDRDLYDKIFYATCQYAKRQRTWFKKSTPHCVVESGELSTELVSAIEEFVKR